MNTLDIIRQRYQQAQSANGSSVLTAVERAAFDAFDKAGIPTVKNEEWKYTRINAAFNKQYSLGAAEISFVASELEEHRLPGGAEANEIVFINGLYAAALSTIRSTALVVLKLDEIAKGEQGDFILQQIGHSGKYIKDGIHALNTAFVAEGLFLQVKKGQVLEHPVYIYNIADARPGNLFSQPRVLVHIAEAAQARFVETYITVGAAESFTNSVIEFVVEKDAVVDYYKIQNDTVFSNQVSTTHFRQVGKSVVNSVTISLNGGMVRNNLNMAMEAEHSEANLYGLYFLRGTTHVDNHTIVDNQKPHLLSNELYKGVIDDNATAIFNGKIFVQPDAQKINAFQSNKNILLSDGATVNTKPQLEIYADDVKCSHGCTVGQLDEEALFYLRSRGVSEKTAKSLLVHAFALDVLDHIKLEPIRRHIDELITQRLNVEIAEPVETGE